MAHVELSLSEVFPTVRQAPRHSDSSSFVRWAATVSEADEPCLLIDRETTVAAASRAACTLLRLGTPAEVVGVPLLKGGLRLLDFTAARSALPEEEVDRIPPLLALSSGRLARGLLRVSGPAADSDATVDAVSTPVVADGVVTGSLTFFSPV